MTTTQLQHQPWCTDTGHDEDAMPCGIAAVEITPQCAVWANEHGPDGIDSRIIVQMDERDYPGITPQEARRLAAELIRMANALDETDDGQTLAT